MTKKTLIKLILCSSVGILLGLFLGRTSIFTILYLIAGTGLVTLTFVIEKIINTSTQKQKSIVSSYSGLTSITLVFAVVTSSITMNIIANNKLKQAESLIPKIEDYKKQYNQYPTTLSELNIDNPNKLNYWTDTTKQNFVISFLADGWHYSRYDSQEKNGLRVIKKIGYNSTYFS